MKMSKIKRNIYPGYVKLRHLTTRYGDNYQSFLKYDVYEAVVNPETQLSELEKVASEGQGIKGDSDIVMRLIKALHQGDLYVTEADYRKHYST